MTQFKKSKVLAYALILAFVVSLFSFSSIPVEAKAKKTKVATVKTTSSIGGGIIFYGVTDIKVKKSKGTKKKKIETHRNSVKLRTGGYYTSSSNYKSQKKYEKARDQYKYKTTYDYVVYFLKAGTYTVTYNTYVSSEYKYVDGKGGYYGPGKIVKHTVKVTVSQPGYGVKSVQFGKAINSYSVTQKKFKKTSVSKYNPYVTSSSAKLTVNMFKGFKIQKIEVDIRNANGGWQTFTYNGNNKTKQVVKGVPVNTYKPASAGSSYAPATYISVYYKTPSGGTEYDSYRFYYGR
ncbi:MAG: hypothetical protein J5517_04595 [Eubacterium sp.]|nr:hypothetical protein [Eubacterium sp.]